MQEKLEKTIPSTPKSAIALSAQKNYKKKDPDLCESYFFN